MNLVEADVNNKNMDEAWRPVWNDIRRLVRDKVTDKIWYPIAEIVTDEVRSNIEVELRK